MRLGIWSLLATVIISILITILFGNALGLDASEEVLTANTLPVWAINALREGKAEQRKRRSRRS